jgi:hypothetical protein
VVFGVFNGIMLRMKGLPLLDILGCRHEQETFPCYNSKIMGFFWGLTSIGTRGLPSIRLFFLYFLLLFFTFTFAFASCIA